MAFDVTADAYGEFMGRYAEPLAVLFADWIGVAPGMRALDVGCGPGALTAVLVDRLGPESVAGLDPSPSFVAAAQQRFPALDVRQGVAERLPHPNDAFDVTAAQAPYTYGVGPAGDYVRGLDDAKRAEVRPRCAEVLGPGPFEVEASAWCARGHA